MQDLIEPDHPVVIAQYSNQSAIPGNNLLDYFGMQSGWIWGYQSHVLW